ncbi:MAG: M23 family metallopeptidase [Mycobacteriales bacterium]|nr:M23 family metallopeptidase [Mycobacteriales bacterium]
MTTSRRALAAALAAVAVGVPVTPTQAAEGDEVRERLRESAGELEDSTAAVQAAAAQLRRVAAALPAAQRAAAQARGELAGAQARAAEAARAVRTTELAVTNAQRHVDVATAEVEQGLADIGLLARRTYQQGPLGDLAAVMETGSPQELVDRAETVQFVFRGLDGQVAAVARDRLALANTTARLEAQQQQLERARAEALAGEERARSTAQRAQAAAARVDALVRQRAAVLAGAEKERAADLAEYQRAQAASRALAARLKAAAEARKRDGSVSPRRNQGRMLWPADGPMTSRYGYRTHPIYGDRRFHAGIDIGAGSGSPIAAADDGVVVFAGEQSGYGKSVAISHGTEGGRELVSFYAHQSAILVNEGQTVRRGQTVGRVGSTGNSTGPHLHFETRLDGSPVDPLNYVSPP